MLTLKALIEHYERGDRWYASDGSGAITAKTEASAKRNLLAAGATERDRTWDEETDSCWELCREITMRLTQQTPWTLNLTLESVGVELPGSLTLQNLISLGSILRAAYKHDGA